MTPQRPTPVRPALGARLRGVGLGLLLGAALAQGPTPTAPAQTPPAQTQPTPTTPAPTAPAPTTPAQEAPPEVSITVERKTDSGETRIIEIRRVGTDETGIAATCAPRDEDPPGTPTITVYSETTERGVEVKVDKNVIRAPLAVVTKKEGGDGRVEVSAGTARYLDAAPEGKTDRFSLCEVEVQPRVTPGSVDVTQGKTRLKGSNLVYDESDGIARISGPINFNREDLTGTSERIEVDVDEETTTLVGNVEFRDGERTSRAARVDYDDTRNIAIMRGTPERPAESVTPRDSLKAQTIRYNLDTGEVVALGPGGGITGTFEDGEESGETPGTPAPATPATPGTPSTPSTP